MMGSKAFESPLISHVRMRALYRALVEVRALGPILASSRIPRGQEAAWVATSIDMQDGDLVSDALGQQAVQHIRRVGRRIAAGAPRLGELRETTHSAALKFPGTGAERMMCAIGQSLALQQARAGKVCIALVADKELKPAEWKRLLTVGREGDLPLIVVCTNAASGSATGRRVAGVPVIPVDGGDVLAIYRVMQECCVRARAEGGLAVIECSATRVDPVRMFADQLVKKSICTQRWVEICEPQFRAVLAQA